MKLELVSRMNNEKFNRKFSRIKKTGIFPGEFNPDSRALREFNNRNYSGLDWEILRHVIAANELPYVFTLSSCAGHYHSSWPLRNEQDPKKSGVAWIHPGHLYLVFNYSPESEELIKRISELKQQHPSIVIEPMTFERELELNTEHLSRGMTIEFHQRQRNFREGFPVKEAEKRFAEQTAARDALLGVLEQAPIGQETPKPETRRNPFRWLKQVFSRKEK